jgi:formamidase
MSGLGGLNKSQNGVVIGLVQLQLPVTETKEDLTQQTEKVCERYGRRSGLRHRSTWWSFRNTCCTASP